MKNSPRNWEKEKVPSLSDQVKRTAKSRAMYTRNFFKSIKGSLDAFVDELENGPFTISIDPENDESLALGIFELQKKLGFSQKDNSRGCDGKFGPYTKEVYGDYVLEKEWVERRGVVSSDIAIAPLPSPEAGAPVESSGAAGAPEVSGSNDADQSGADNGHELLREGTRVLKYPVSPKALEIINGFSAEEEFVEFQDPYSKKTLKLRKTAEACLQLAREFAKRDGYDVMVAWGYRNHAEQERLWNRSDASGKRVAEPGQSWHHSGGAVDCYLVMAGDPKGGPLKTRRHFDSLEQYMNQAGFVRYEAERWHFEVGTKGWEGIMRKDGIALPSGSVYKRI